MISYKLLTYQGKSGPRAGILIDEEILDVAMLTRIPSYKSMLNILNDWESSQAIIDSALKELREKKIKPIPLDKAKLLAPVLYPSTIFCAGANYLDHLQEMAAVKNIEPDPDPRTLGLKPWHFIKTSRSVIGTGSTIKLPPYSKIIDWEAELTVVIGRVAKNIPPGNALDYVAGYTIANDLSLRDQAIRPHLPLTSPFRYDWVSQKCFDCSCPIGPWIVPAMEIKDPQNLGIKLWVNDILKQDSNTSKMIFSVAEQISHLSTRVTLYPGDLILTGTPSGVGSAKGESLKPGDVVRIWIEKIGVLTNIMA